MRRDDHWFGPSFTPEAGIEYAQRFLAERAKQRASAVVLGNDAMALGFMRVVLQYGLRIPEDVSVVGFDGVPEGALAWPGLTTVVQPTRAMAASACRSLLEAIEKETKSAATSLEYGVELVIRESTSKPAGC
jgi:LacI family transcriptional regulator